MSNVRWSVDGPDEEGLEVEGRRFSTNDEGAPMMCSLVCQALGRHVHIDYCRAKTPSECRGNSEVQHIAKSLRPDPDRPKDFLTHNLFWKRSGKFIFTTRPLFVPDLLQGSKIRIRAKSKRTSQSGKCSCDCIVLIRVPLTPMSPSDSMCAGKFFIQALLVIFMTSLHRIRARCFWREARCPLILFPTAFPCASERQWPSTKARLYLQGWPPILVQKSNIFTATVSHVCSCNETAVVTS